MDEDRVRGRGIRVRGGRRAGHGGRGAGQRAITEVPGQRGGNITLCAAMGSEGLVHRHAVLGSYNTQRLLTFLEELKDILLDRQCRTVTVVCVCVCVV